MKKLIVALLLTLTPLAARAQSTPGPIAIPQIDIASKPYSAIGVTNGTSRAFSVGLVDHLGNPIDPATGSGGGTPATVYSGQRTLTTTAAALPSQVLSVGIVITAQPANTGTVYVGPTGVTSATGYPLVAGQSISYSVSNLSAVFVIGTNTSDTIAFTGN